MALLYVLRLLWRHVPWQARQEREVEQRQRRREQMGERVRQQRRQHLDAMVVPWAELSPRGRTIAARSPRRVGHHAPQP